jgi:hypothetical protein
MAGTANVHKPKLRGNQPKTQNKPTDGYRDITQQPTRALPTNGHQNSPGHTDTSGDFAYRNTPLSL